MSDTKCKGTNCRASRANEYRHSSECLFEHAANVASGIKSVEAGMEIPEHLAYVYWRGRRIALDTPPASIPAAEVLALVERWRNGLADEVSEADIAYNHAMKACADELAKLIPRNPVTEKPKVKCERCMDTKQEFNANGDGPFPCRHCYVAPNGINTK